MCQLLHAPGGSDEKRTNRHGDGDKVQGDIADRDIHNIQDAEHDQRHVTSLLNK